jgi:hypothetical protein
VGHPIIIIIVELLGLISVPTNSTTIPLRWMGLPNKKGAGATAGVAGRTGGDFFSTGARATLFYLSVPFFYF